MYLFLNNVSDALNLYFIRQKRSFFKTSHFPGKWQVFIRQKDSLAYNFPENLKI